MLDLDDCEQKSILLGAPCWPYEVQSLLETSTSRRSGVPGSRCAMHAERMRCFNLCS